MKKLISCFVTIAIILAIFFSCKKELSFENGQTSVGILLKDGANNCLPLSVNGSYASGKALDASDYLEVQVHITASGSFLIRTDTVNGIFFRAVGNFKDTGYAFVKLIAYGTPINPGQVHVNVVYGKSNCEATLTVIDSNRPAEFTLQGAPGVCMNDSVIGNYLKGHLLDTSNKVNIMVNVTVQGRFNVSTTAVNGYSFSAAGMLTATGVQTITLTGSGTPVNAQHDVFSVSGTNSACTFAVDVLSAVDVTNNFHFPLTGNSYWNYDDLLNAGDTIARKINGNINVNSNNYQVMNEQKMFGAPVPFYFRYSASDSTYYEYGNVDKYTKSFQYNKDVKRDIPFLKEYLSKGAYWESPEYRDTASFGQVIILKYTYTCLDNDAVVTINGKTFAGVYKILVAPKLRSEGNPYGPTSDVFTIYYAKGVGLVYMKYTVNNFLNTEIQIRNWQVF